MADKKHALISLTRVTKAYGSNEAKIFALRGIDLSIESGEFISVMGPSGLGQIHLHEHPGMSGHPHIRPVQVLVGLRSAI